VASQPELRDGHVAIIVRLVVTVETEPLDLVVETRATKVRHEDTLRRVAGAYASIYDWHVTVRPDRRVHLHRRRIRGLHRLEEVQEVLCARPAHKPRSRWSESVSVPPWRMVMNRRSRSLGRMTNER
jgi:hypothetical protein